MGHYRESLQALRIVEPEVSWQVARIWNGGYLSYAAQAWMQVCQETWGAGTPA